MGKAPDLTGDELLLWQQATRNTKRLGKSQPDVIPPPPKAAPKAIPAPKPKPKAAKKAPSSLAQGNYAGVDAANARRLKRGDYPIDYTLDLHGMDRLEAHDALRKRVETAYHAGKRCLLVITGKGRGEGEGILRKSLPVWLNDMGQYVLAFDVATPKHGGAGAFYVLVKRKRDNDGR